MSDDDSRSELPNGESVGVRDWKSAEVRNGESAEVRNEESVGAPNEKPVGTRQTVAVQFVFEVENESVAEQFLDRLPGPESPNVTSAGYRSYVDSAGLRWPVVGASIPHFNRRCAEELYETLRGVDGVERSVRSGTLVLRRFDGGVGHDEKPTVVAATRYP